MWFLYYCAGFVVYAFSVAIWIRVFPGDWLARVFRWHASDEAWNTPLPLFSCIAAVLFWPAYLAVLLGACLVRFWMYVAGFLDSKPADEEKQCKHGYR